MAGRATSTGNDADPRPSGSCNEVRLVGRVSGVPEERTLPSGDQVVTFRLVVRRPPRRTTSSRGTARGAAKAVGASTTVEHQGPTVDTIDVACWTSRPRRAALRLRDGDTAEVSGSLHRRFYRAGGAPASRYEVSADTVVRLRP